MSRTYSVGQSPRRIGFMLTITGCRHSTQHSTDQLPDYGSYQEKWEKYEQAGNSRNDRLGPEDWI